LVYVNRKQNAEREHPRMKNGKGRKESKESQLKHVSAVV
jgi:hypothetical protein